jgi:hypothetical protein
MFNDLRLGRFGYSNNSSFDEEHPTDLPRGYFYM